MSNHDIVLYRTAGWWYRESIVAHIPYNPSLLGPRGKVLMEHNRTNIDITHTIDWGRMGDESNE